MPVGRSGGDSDGWPDPLLPPELADRWANAEGVLVNEEPHYLRIYLRSGEDVEQAVSMARTALERRG